MAAIHFSSAESQASDNDQIHPFGDQLPLAQESPGTDFQVSYLYNSQTLVL